MRKPRVPTLLLLATAPVAAAVLCAMLAPQLAPYDPARGDLSARLQPPAWTAAGSARHLLGTDQLGRDILSRIIFGARVSLLVGVVSSLIGGTVGLALGMLGGYFRGRADSVIAKLIDVQLAFPFLLFAITVIAVLGPSLPNLLTILAVSGWVTYARVVRGQTLSLRETDFIQAARGLGCPAWWILLRHVLRARDHDHRDRSADRARVHPELPGARRAPADAELGHGARRRQGVSDQRLVAGHVSRARHHAGRAMHERPGRRRPRSARAAASWPTRMSRDLKGGSR
jgi:ABC-type nitrate/sulfonate/bicarbonate transport system permease component